MSVYSSAGRVALALLALGLQPATAHIALWHPSVYGFNASGIEPANWYNEPENTHFLNTPLRKKKNLSFDEWWFHGLIGAVPNAIMSLPAGGSITTELSCNKAFTSYGPNADQVGNVPCNENMVNGHATYGDPSVHETNGPIHASDINDAKGCALAIAYTSDAKSVKPEDFVVFSVNHTCVWYRETVFQIPADMPPCPNGKCICSWHWTHGVQQYEGYGNEIYMNGFDCNIVNSKSQQPLATPNLPTKCVSDPKSCVQGAKQALFWQGAVVHGNIPDDGSGVPPFYNQDWGFADGPQNDIFMGSRIKTASKLGLPHNDTATAPQAGADGPSDGIYDKRSFKQNFRAHQLGRRQHVRDFDRS